MWITPGIEQLGDVMEKQMAKQIELNPKIEAGGELYYVLSDDVRNQVGHGTSSPSLEYTRNLAMCILQEVLER